MVSNFHLSLTLVADPAYAQEWLLNIYTYLFNDPFCTLALFEYTNSTTDKTNVFRNAAQTF